jgi:hypothetical protein
MGIYWDKAASFRAVLSCPPPQPEAAAASLGGGLQRPTFRTLARMPRTLSRAPGWTRRFGHVRRTTFTTRAPRLTAPDEPNVSSTHHTCLCYITVSSLISMPALLTERVSKSRRRSLLLATATTPPAVPATTYSTAQQRSRSQSTRRSVLQIAPHYLAPSRDRCRTSSLRQVRLESRATELYGASWIAHVHGACMK